MPNLLLDIFFFKNSEETIREEDIQKRISITTVFGDAKQTLYSLLNDIFKPIIDSEVDLVNNSVNPLINNLRTCLHSSGNTLSQEFDNWSHEIDIGNEKYRQYDKVLDDYRKKLIELENGMNLDDIEEALNDTYYIDFLSGICDVSV